MEWLRFTSSEDSPFVGPVDDHTLDSVEGHSLLAPISGFEHGSMAVIVSSLINDSPGCVAVWYGYASTHGFHDVLFHF
jgi:hypothetical protein